VLTMVSGGKQKLNLLQCLIRRPPARQSMRQGIRGKRGQGHRKENYVSFERWWCRPALALQGRVIHAGRPALLTKGRILLVTSPVLVHQDSGLEWSQSTAWTNNS
jgi:hypothetical protein